MSTKFKVRFFLQGLRPYAQNECELRNSLWMSTFEPEAQNTLFSDPAAVGTGWANIFKETLSNRAFSTAKEPLDRVIDSFSTLYLHDDILVKVDRASMAHSLEVRAPFLDKTLTSFIARLPTRMKMKGFKRKLLLKRAMADSLPRNVLRRPKKGFGIPLASWFRGPLRQLAQDTLSRSQLEERGLFSVEYVQQLLGEHNSRKFDHRKQLWSLLVFELWRQQRKV